jgi:hypothetical protein
MMNSASQNNTMPPTCSKHNNEPMVLNFYYRGPGDPMGNGWMCRSCAKEREQQQTDSKPSAPDGYAYRYADGVRFTDGREINSSRPIAAIPYYFGKEQLIIRAL